MRTSKRGLPLAADRPENQCEAVTIMTRWKRERKIGPRCPFYAKFRVNGKQLCLKHSHLEALFLLLRDGKAKRLPLPPPPRSPYHEVPTVK